MLAIEHFDVLTFLLWLVRAKIGKCQFESSVGDNQDSYFENEIAIKDWNHSGLGLS